MGQLEEAIEPTLDGMGYLLVRVLVTGQMHKTLQVMADRKDGGAMTIDDCAAISRMLSTSLAVAVPITKEYALEVSSPGIDRPLTRKEDFVDWAGFEVRVETQMPIDGRRRFAGTLLGLTEDATAVRMQGRGDEEGVWVLPVDMISKAKLALTDDLIAAALRGGGVSRQDVPD